MTITVDLSKAKEIWRNKIRDARTDEFKKLDIEYMRADETGDADAKAKISARKQELRNAPTNAAIDTATTLEELKAYWPFE